MSVFLRVRSVKLRRRNQSEARAYLDQRCDDETGHSGSKRNSDHEKSVWVYTEPNVTVKFFNLTGLPLCDGFSSAPPTRTRRLSEAATEATKTDFRVE